MLALVGAAGCGSKTPDYQSIWSTSATTTSSAPATTEKPVPFPPEPAAAIGINLVRAAMNQADHREGKRNLFLKTLDALGMGFDS